MALLLKKLKIKPKNAIGFFKNLKIKLKSKSEFYSFPQKKIARERLNAFWRDYKKGKRVRKLISPYSKYNNRQVIAVTKTVIGTVRVFRSETGAKEYAKITKGVFESIKKANPKTFELHPIQILDIRGKNVLERVYLTPSILDIKCSWFENRKYLTDFVKRINKKGIPLKKIEEKIYEAYMELQSIRVEKALNFDHGENNVLVLDYNPKTKKVLLGLVDLYE